MGSNPSPAVVSEIPTRFLPGDRRYQPLVVVALALAAGIAIDRYLPQWGTPTGNSRWMACWLTSGGLWWLWLILWRRGQLRASSYLLLAAVAVTGATWPHQCWRLFSVHEVARYARGQYEPGRRFWRLRWTVPRFFPLLDRTRSGRFRADRGAA